MFQCRLSRFGLIFSLSHEHFLSLIGHAITDIQTSANVLGAMELQYACKFSVFPVNYARLFWGLV